MLICLTSVRCPNHRKERGVTTYAVYKRSDLHSPVLAVPVGAAEAAVRVRSAVQALPRQGVPHLFRREKGRDADSSARRHPGLYGIRHRQRSDDPHHAPRRCVQHPHRRLRPSRRYNAAASGNERRRRRLYTPRGAFASGIRLPGSSGVYYRDVLPQRSGHSE